MKCLILLVVVGACAALPQGQYIADTPEVQFAKQQFYEQYQIAAARASPSVPGGAYAPQTYSANTHRFVPQAHSQQQAYARPAQQSWAPSQSAPRAQRPVEIADVGAATADFFRAYQAAAAGFLPDVQQAAPRAAAPRPSASQYYQSAPAVQQPRWTGPLAATVPAGLPGSSAVIEETPEVMAAKVAFGQSFQRQLMSVLGRDIRPVY